MPRFSLDGTGLRNPLTGEIHTDAGGFGFRLTGPRAKPVYNLPCGPDHHSCCLTSTNGDFGKHTVGFGKPGRRTLTSIAVTHAPTLGARLATDIFNALAEQTVVVPGTTAADMVLPRLATA